MDTLIILTVFFLIIIALSLTMYQIIYNGAKNASKIQPKVIEIIDGRFINHVDFDDLAFDLMDEVHELGLKDKTTYRVGITNYTTEEGAKIRCQGLYKRHGVDAEVTIFSDNEKPIKLHASDIWDLNR